MTREEAIFTLENGAWWDSLNDDMSDADKNPLFDALDMAISALRAQQEKERNDRLQRAMNRLGEFGKLFVEYEGELRGALGRACAPLEEEVLAMPEITDADGGIWVPVNADALRDLVNQYKRMLDREEPMTNADRIRAMSDEELAGWISNLLNECIPCDGCNRSLCWEDSCLKWLQQPAEEGTV